jgi:hypothetical protein
MIFFFPLGPTFPAIWPTKGLLTPLASMAVAEATGLRGCHRFRGKLLHSTKRKLNTTLDQQYYQQFFQ